MKAIYITSIENFSGKTAVLLGVGKRLQAEGYKVGYLKPLSYEATQVGGRVVDEDATFVKNVLALDKDPRDLAPVVITPAMLPDCLEDDGCGLEDKIREAIGPASEGKDVLLLEGGGSLRMGYALGLSTPHVAEMLDAQVLVVVKYRGRLRLLDDALAAQFRLGDRLLGVVLNRVPDTELEFVEKEAVPFLESKGIPVLGTIVERPELAAISVGELIDVLDARPITKAVSENALVENLMVGAMSAQEALSRFRQIQNKAVITGGDRTDVQLAALETSTTALILTGNLQPSAAVIERAEQLGVTVLLVSTNTLETVEAIEGVFGKTRLGQAAKLARFEALMAEYMDYQRLFKLLNLESSAE
ncbi:MAG: phosphotransacetylase family protein [Chloroflexi bacterium]|nr:phosphotransacetylase family protein [Chloroflexota bacterium]